MNEYFKEKELPLKELEKLGLYKNGSFLLGKEELDTLLAGRRTGLLQMKNLEFEGVRIEGIDAKLSLIKNEQGKIEVSIHPIYKTANTHPLLDVEETRELLAGKVQSVKKEVEKNGVVEELMIEYDGETREFVAYDPKKVQAPEFVNGQQLTPAQQLAFRNGKVVKLADGTRLQHSGVDKNGVRSDNKALVLSVLIDGGISYLLLRGLENLLGNDKEQKAYTAGYTKAVAEMMGHTDKRKSDQTVGDFSPEAENAIQHEKINDRNRKR